MSQITRSMREAVNQIATDRDLRHPEAVLRQCVASGLLTFENGEYTPTPAGFEASNQESRHSLDLLNQRIRGHRIARARRHVGGDLQLLRATYAE